MSLQFNPRLKMALENTYTALSEFLQAAASVFSSPYGKKRKTAVIAAD
jgi:hypothetical protein